MEKAYLEKIQLHTDPILELIFSLQRVGAYEQYNKLSKEYGIALDEDIETYVKEVYTSIDDPMKELLTFYFNDDGYFGLGLGFIVNELQEPITFDSFIAHIENMSSDELCYCLLLAGCQGKMSMDEFCNNKQEEGKFDLIEKYFTVSSTGKWRIFKIMSKTDMVKDEVLTLLRYYYNTFYKQKEKEVSEFLTNYITVHELTLKESFIKSVSPILSEEMEVDMFHNREYLGLLVSYFTEWGSYFSFGTEGLVIGYRYPEMVQIMAGGSQGLLSKLNVLKLLADETRLKILLHMKEEPKYLTEIADTMGFSTPAVKYHLDKFLSVGLIQIDKSDNRIYYKLNKKKFEELIFELRRSFNI